MTTNSILKFAQAGITGRDGITGGGKCKAKSNKSHKSNKSRKSHKSNKSNKGGCCY